MEPGSNYTRRNRSLSKCFGLILAAVLCFAQTFDRVLLLEEKGETSANVSIGDLNGDGFPDVVLAKGRHWPLHDRVLLNDGKGRFPIALNLSDTPDRTYATSLGDLDGDGDLDLVVSNAKPDRKLIYLNDGKGLFTLRGTFGEPDWSTRNVTLADLNGDKRLDIVVANRMMTSFVCFNDGKAGFASCKALATRSATSIAAADMDRDGDLDLVVPLRDGARGGRSLILWNDGKGGFETSSPFGREKASARAVAVGDLNGTVFPTLPWETCGKGRWCI